MYKQVFQKVGRCSWFGGASDTGVGENEGLALVQGNAALSSVWRDLFVQPVDMSRGIARQLRENARYCAMRWDYSITPPSLLARSIVYVAAQNGRVAWCRPVDWGPNIKTGRVIDLSKGVLGYLAIATDDVVTCALLVPDDA